MRYDFRSLRDELGPPGVEFAPGGQILPLGIIFYASRCLFSVQEFILFWALGVQFWPLGVNCRHFQVDFLPLRGNFRTL